MASTADTTRSSIVTYVVTLLSDVSSPVYRERHRENNRTRGFALARDMAEPLELKKTLNLPKTDFPMKASLPQNEPKQLAAWQDGNLYEAILAARKGKPLFVLHDGPPYPTGTIHLGTGLNKILKDLIVKTKSMAGHYAPYVPG